MLSSSCFNIILTLNEGRKKKKKKTLEQFVMCPSPELAYWQIVIYLSP